MGRITFVHWRLIDGMPHVRFPFDRRLLEELKIQIHWRDRKWNGYLKAWGIAPGVVEIAHRLFADRWPLCSRCLAKEPCVVWPPPEPKPVAPDYIEDDWRDFRGFEYSDGGVQDW